MREIGVVLHLAKSGRLIIKVNQAVEPGAIIFDSKGGKVGRVLELIGPVRSPYASATPMTDRATRILGQPVFLGQ